MAFGGTNYQDIYSQHEQQLLKHSQSISREFGSHTVNIVNNTVLHSVLGTDSLIVNSYHHQAVKDVAPGFRVRDRGGHGRDARTPHIQRAMAPGENGSSPG